ncbi:hypothetical protein [Rheinheimera aquimaris]|uniref:hypothetical protein n=1 Tax=Rheinheimera aquimaris TaxID=412437 RepID=UPI001065B5EF|nr:hypothetical protein [Rheinheimera aquimaris]
MPDFEIKAALLQTVRQQYELAAPPLSSAPVQQKLDHLLQSIGAPIDLAGFYFVSHTLARILLPTVPGFSSELHIDAPLRDALGTDMSNMLSKKAMKAYKKTSPTLGWAENHPLYYLLFLASGLKSSADDNAFLTVFVVQYLRCKHTLEAPELQTTKTLTGEVCRAFRQIQHKQQILINVEQISSKIERWEAGDIAWALQQLLDENQLNKDFRKTLRFLICFFSNKWKEPVRRGPTGPQRRKRSGGGGRSVVRPDQGLIDSETLPPLTETVEESVVEVDVEILRSHYSTDIDEAPEQEPSDKLSIGAVFDAEKRQLAEINITRHLRQQNNATLSNKQLLSAGSIRLIKHLAERFFSRNSENEAALAIYCMFSTSMPLSQLLPIQLTRQHDNELDSIVVTDSNCYWRLKHRRSSKALQRQPDYLYHCDQWALTPCSALLEQYCRTRVAAGADTLFSREEAQLTRQLEKLLQRTTEKLKANYISATQLQHFLPRFAEANTAVDPIVLDFSYQQDIFATRVSRSYVNLTTAQRVDMLNRLWREVGKYAHDDTTTAFFQPQPVTESTGGRVGSAFVPTADFCRQFIFALQSRLRQAKPASTLSLAAIVNYHNAYIRYVSWMLNFGSGYRAVYNPLPTFAMHNPEDGVLVVSDKDDGEFSNSRIVILPGLLNMQIIHLRSHLVRLAELLALFAPALYKTVNQILGYEKQLRTMNAESTKQWFLAMRNAKDATGPLFHINTELVARAVSPAWLKHNSTEQGTVPANMGRHWLKTALITAGVDSELINFQLGHWNEGQSPLFEYSSISINECVRELAPQIEQLMAEQGWLAWKSDLL